MFALYVIGSVTTTSTINGINLHQDAVTKTSDGTISGPKTFQDNVAVQNDVVVNGTVDGVDVSKLDATSATTNSNNLFTAPKLFTDKVTVLQQMKISGLIGGINLTKLREEILTTNRPQTVEASLEFGNLNMRTNLNVSGTINGVHVPQQLFSLDADEVVTSPDDIVLHRGVLLSANSTLNGEVLSEFQKDVALQGVNQTVNGRKIFKNDMSVEKYLTIEGMVNGYKLPLDFILLSSTQKISGVKTFLDGVEVHGALSSHVINVSSTVNGVDISELVQRVLYNKQNLTIDGSLEFLGHVISKGDIRLEGLLDQVNLTQLFNSVARLSVPQNISSCKTFAKHVVLYETLATAGSISGIDLVRLDAHAFKKTQRQHVTGTKVLSNSTRIQGSLNNGTLNGISLGEFIDMVVHRHGSHVVVGQLTILNDVSATNMAVVGKFDGLSLFNLLLTHDNQTVAGYKTFVKNMSLRMSMDVSKTVNGISVAALARNMMTTNGDQNSSALLLFRKGFSVNGSIHVGACVNSLNISNLRVRAVRMDGSQVIAGQKTFEKTLKVEGNVVFMNLVSGVNVSGLLSDVMLKSTEQLITADKIFSSGDDVTLIASRISLAGIEVSGLLDDVNITELDGHAVKIDLSQVLHGAYSFTNHVSFLTNIATNGLVNGIRTTNILTKYGYQIVAGYKTFRRMRVYRNINITGKVDGVDVSDFGKSRVTISTNQQIIGSKTFQSNVTITGNVDMATNATWNGIDVAKELLQTEGSRVIIGEKSLVKDMNVVGHFNITGLINGINLTSLNDDILRVNRKKILTGLSTFLHDIKVQGTLCTISLTLLSSFPSIISACTAVLLRHFGMEHGTTLSGLF